MAQEQVDEIPEICKVCPKNIARPLFNGVDIVNVEDIEKILGQDHAAQFLEDVFTPSEIRLFGNDPASLAGRIAAKEAVSKAMGTGIGVDAWTDIEVLSNELGKPTLTLTGWAQKTAEELGVTQFSVSISHEHYKPGYKLAIAYVVAM